MNIFEFISNSISIPVFMQVISILFLISILILMVKSRRQRIKDIHDITELKRDLRALTTAALGVGERVLQVERQQHNGVSKNSKVVRFSTNNETSYEHAIHLVQNGAKVDDLVNTCGLSQGEADLVSLLHRINNITDPDSCKI